MTEPESGDSSVNTPLRVVSVLRLAAIALVIAGFTGWVLEDDALALESPYTLAFAAGVVCALASIYLGLFLANRGESR
ncbi:hypothetical protein [Natrialba sp. INN-245]|uniref:hypothetical protein n=1 Tax=Natrialba sp. INN-245 TaxID=2690967 RepID=UPI00130FD0FE|nr:hypothetical protein [Natrialba sp. INN-245]